MILTSKLNPLFRSLEALLHSKGLRESDRMLIHGRKLGPEIAQQGRIPILQEVRTSEMPPISAAQQVLLSPELFRRIDSLGTDSPILVVKQPKIENLEASHSPEGIEVVLPLGNPQNLGAALRSALAFGSSKAILTSESSHPCLPQCVRASAQAVLHLPLYRIEKLALLKGPILALDTRGESLFQTSFPQNFRLVVGEEGRGLPPLSHARNLNIPTHGIESLNASVAISIALAFASYGRGARS